jgi:hypothetical protein
MTVDAELAAWGEPPVSAEEQVLIAFLDQALERRLRGEEVGLEELAALPGLSIAGSALLQVAECVEDLVASVLANCGLGDFPADASTVLYEGPGAVPEGFPGAAPTGFRVRAFLGEGSFSQVWLADHLRLGVPVALKTLPFQSTGAPLPLSPEELFRLTQEGAVSAGYRATRNMERVQSSVQQLRREDWQAVVLELDHRAG